MAYNVKEIESFQSGTGEEVRVFKVWQSTAPEYTAPNVWLNNGTRCTECQGRLTAMLANCPHTRAVKRFLKRANQEDGNNEHTDL